MQDTAGTTDVHIDIELNLESRLAFVNDFPDDRPFTDQLALPGYPFFADFVVSVNCIPLELLCQTVIAYANLPILAERRSDLTLLLVL